MSLVQHSFIRYALHYATTMNTTPISDIMDRTLTLTDIAAAQNVKKRSAQLWLSKAKAEHGEIGELRGKTRYYSESEKALLLSYASEPKLRPNVAKPVAVEVVTGNHRAIVPNPQIGGRVDLSRFRGAVEVRTYNDPRNPAAAAMDLLNAVGEAMDADLAQSFSKLESTAATVAELESAANELEAKALEYKITQSILARLQNEATGRLSSLLGKAQRLTGNNEVQ